MKPGIKAVETDEETASGEASEAEAPAPLTGVHSFAEKIGSRNLMIAIVTMPFFFIGALALIIAIAGLPEGEEPPAPALDDSIGASPPLAAPDAPAPPPQPAALQETPASAVSAAAAPLPSMIPPGGIALDGDRLAVRIERADGDVIVIYDLARGEVVNEVPLSALAGTTRP